MAHIREIVSRSTTHGRGNGEKDGLKEAARKGQLHPLWVPLADADRKR